MGVIISCKKTSKHISMGYIRFTHLRNTVAKMVDDELYQHYLILSSAKFFMLKEDEEESFFLEYNKKTEEILKNKYIPSQIIDFLFQADYEGKIRYRTCKKILKLINNNEIYISDNECIIFNKFKNILECCIKAKSDLIWF